MDTRVFFFFFGKLLVSVIFLNQEIIVRIRNTDKFETNGGFNDF